MIEAIDTELEKAAEAYAPVTGKVRLDIIAAYEGFLAGAAYRDRHPSKEVAALVDALKIAVELIEHEHSDDERGWESMCCDCEYERKYREALEEFENSIAKGKPWVVGFV
jgi:hypothetical protein